MQNEHRKYSDCGSCNRQRTAECASRRRACVGRSSDQDYTTGPSAPGTAVGQVVDTRVIGRPGKWDGSEKAYPNWSFVMKAHAGAIDQALLADMTTAECSTDAMSNDTMTGGKNARSVELYFVLIMLSWDELWIAL